MPFLSPAMPCLRNLLIGAFVVLASASPGVAQEKAPPGAPANLAQEVHALRQMVDVQTKQIEALRLAVVQLTETEKKREIGAEEKAEPTKPEPRHPEEAATAPAEASSTAPAATVADTAGSAEAPHAEPATASGPQHTVAKGETLTSIAKHYNISIAELHKANKITDDRKLQIGQVLIIPTPKTAEHPPEKKETP